METINNKHGIKMYYRLDETINKVIILDSNKHYFNDLYYDIYDNDDGEEDIQAIIHTLEETDLQEMCNFFNSQAYDSIENLAEDNYLTIDETTNNEYINVFEVNGKLKYTFSW